MAYKLEREKARSIELEVNGEILEIPVGGMNLYHKVLEAQSKLKDIQTKISNMNKENQPITEELVKFLGDTIIYLFKLAFGEKNTDKILAFYEGNYDEMLLKVYPFFLKEYFPALKEKALSESKEYAKRLASAT